MNSQLKDLCALFGLQVSGTKDSLVDALMEFLHANTSKLPDILFLDLNMPRKTGYECLLEIKASPLLKSLPVVIYSTSLNQDMVNLLFEKGAHLYVRKPGQFSDLKKVIHKAIGYISESSRRKPSRHNFVIEG